MRKLGLVGGMSWHSTMLYYRFINQQVEHIKGGKHSAPLAIDSLDFDIVYHLQKQGKWKQLAEVIEEAAIGLHKQGAEAIMLASNTIHLVAGEVAKNVPVPLLHVAEAVIAEIERRNIKTIGITATSYTIDKRLYDDYLAEKGIELLKPDEQQKAVIDDYIFNYLIKGENNNDLGQKVTSITNDIIQRGADAMLSGCTEIQQSLLGNKIFVPVFNSAMLHANMGARFVLGEKLVF